MGLVNGDDQLPHWDSATALIRFWVYFALVSPIQGDSKEMNAGIKISRIWMRAFGVRDDLDW